jgi:hypothetical protein
LEPDPPASAVEADPPAAGAAWLPELPALPLPLPLGPAFADWRPLAAWAWSRAGPEPLELWDAQLDWAPPPPADAETPQLLAPALRPSPVTVELPA